MSRGARPFPLARIKGLFVVISMDMCVLVYSLGTNNTSHVLAGKHVVPGW